MGHKFSPDYFTRGFIRCLSNIVHSHGVCVRCVEQFYSIGAPTAKECAAMKLDAWDKTALSMIRKYIKGN